MISIGTLFVALALAQAQGAQAPGAAPSPSAPQAPGQPAAQSPQGAVAPGDSAPSLPAVRPGGAVSIDEERLYRMAGPVLTLEDALARVEKENLDLQASQARLRQAETISRQAWAGYLPQITGVGSYTRNDIEATFGLPTGYYVRDTGTPGPGPGSTTLVADTPSNVFEVTVQRRDQFAGQLLGSQALFIPELWAAIRNAYRQEKAATLQAEGFRRAIVFAAAQAYYGVASLRQLVDASERLLEISRRQERDATIRLKAGTIARVGLVRAEIDRARAEQDLRRARNAYLSAKIALAGLLNRTDLAFEVVNEPPPLAIPANLQTLQDRAVRDRPDVAVAALNTEITRGQRNGIVARYFPTLAAFGRLQWANLGGFTGHETMWAAGVGLQWNIFDGGLREAQLSQANARIDESDAALASARLRALIEVSQALLDFESARANAQKAKEQRDLAAENQRLVDVSYRAGAATALEQADATTALRNAEIALQAESLNAQIAGLRVLQAAGASDPRAGVAGAPAR